MTTLQPKQRGHRLNKGQWFLDQQAQVQVSCPGCGGLGDLNDHRIGAGGKVTPSLKCDCGFHDHVVLAEWDTEDG